MSDHDDAVRMSETKRHDPMCPLGAKDTTYQSWGFVECRCDEYAKVRADEREQHPSIFEVVQSTCGHRWVGSADEGVACPVCEDAGVMTRRALTDLRAKVLGLPRVTDDYYREAVLLSDVLALFPEEKP